MIIFSYCIFNYKQASSSSSEQNWPTTF